MSPILKFSQSITFLFVELRMSSQLLPGNGDSRRIRHGEARSAVIGIVVRDPVRSDGALLVEELRASAT
jgi:hypothetical protein